MNLIIPLSPTHLKEKKLEQQIKGISLLDHIKSNFPSNTKIHLAHSDESNTFGPIYTIKKFLESNDKLEGPVIIHYCDLINFFDFDVLIDNAKDLTLFASNKIHPYRENNHDYSFVQLSPFKVSEKKPLTATPELEHVTTGLYYFRNKEVLSRLITYFDNDKDFSSPHKLNQTCNIEQLFFLASLEDSQIELSIFTKYISVKCDSLLNLNLIESWIDYFTKEQVQERSPKRYEVVIPLAGKGSRFKQRGYKNIKPLLDIDGRSLIEFVTDSIPTAQGYHFVVQEEHLSTEKTLAKTLNKYPNTTLTKVSALTDGQASSAMLAVEKIDDLTPIFVGVCDNTAVWDLEKFYDLIEKETEIIFLSFKGHPNMETSPHSYGWLKTSDSNEVIDVSCKKAISDNPINDHAIVGMFYFKEARIYKELYKKMTEINYRVNNEYYVDTLIASCVNSKYKALALQVDHFLSFGTPNEYESYFYWKELVTSFTKA